MIKIPRIIFSPLPSILIFLWLYNFLNTHFVASQCLDDQKSLLLELKNSLTFGYSNLSVWNESTDCCQWNRIECDKSNGQVIGLDLSELGIVGGLDNSSSLFRLQYLQRLNLAYNFPIQEEIPSAIGKLSSLTYLNLSYTFIGQVPIEISHLVNLVALDMTHFDGISTIEIPNLAAIIQNFTNLRELRLDGVRTSAMGNKWSQAISSSLPRLEVLSMSNCHLSGEMHNSLSKLHHLSVIHLDRNSLVGPIPEILGRLKNLASLTLSYCQLTGVVPSNIFQVPTLTTLDLSFNNLHGSLPVLYENGSLEELDLSFTNFSGLLPSSIGNLKRLRKIHVSGSHFEGSIPSSMGNLKLLEDVDLSANRFSGPVPSFSAAKNLQSLDLHGNYLNGSITTTDWGKPVNLVHIDLSGNSLHGIIPASLFLLPSVQSTLLQNNKFTGQLNEFASASMLDTLDLSNNNFEGPVPKSIFRLKELQTLHLSWNKFNGTLELAQLLQNLNKLTSLDISNNYLSVDAQRCKVNSSFPQLSFLNLASSNLHFVPEFLKNQTSLSNVDLSKNQISGTVPRWVWEMDSLEILNMSFNHLMHLEPPIALSNISLYFLDLHSNNLQGQFPVVSPKLELLECSSNNITSISHYPSIFLLSFSRNNIHGSIPSALCNAPYLDFLNLEYNHLEGTIPECLIAKTTLRVLNLRGNHLRGVIPAKFGKGCSLQTLDLNGNFLQGQIPRSLSNCKPLKVLDLRSNQFGDTFPCHLQSLSNLQVLILRSNSFHGTIICPESHSMWPMLQIIDLAFNHFKSELTAQMLLNLTSMIAGAGAEQSKPGDLNYITSYYEYYQNSVAQSFKGNTYDLPHILIIFTSIDFSNNAFYGKLPRELGNLNALKVLNLSHNSFSGNIPTSIGKLSQIESLDLSCNAFTGNIPPQLANLNFLEYLNLSFNELSGKIPTSTQLQSFDASSYQGNNGLYGPPLTMITGSEPDPATILPNSPERSNWSSMKQIEWMLRGAEIGFPVGITILLGPLLYIERYRVWYCKFLHRLVMKILCKEDNSGGKRRSRQQRNRRN